MIPFDENEHIVLELRRHWFTILNHILFLFVIALAPVIIVTFLVRLFGIEMVTQLLVLLLFLWSLWLIVIWLFFCAEWTDYYLDMWIITNKRVIDINQHGLFSREMATVRLEYIQDVKIEVDGILATFLKLGNIHLQTAGEQREFSLESAYMPEKAKHAINSILDHKEEKPQKVAVHEGGENLTK